METTNIETQYQGDTFDGKTFDIFLNDAPLDLTTVGIRAWFRKGSKSGEIVKKISKGSGITVDDVGVFSFAPFLVDFTPDKYYFDIEFDFDGRYKTYAGGVFPVDPKVTRPTK